MAQWTITIPDAQASRVVDAICTLHGYQPLLPDGTDNPENRPAFARRVIRLWIKEQVKMHESRAAANLAAANATTAVETEIQLT